MDEPPIGRLLGIAGRLVAARFQRLLDAQGMTHAGWQVLLAIGSTERLTQREIAARCYVTPATVTGVVDTLEREGLVVRERGTDDRRLVRVALTAEGRARLARMRKAATKEMDPVFADLTGREEAVVRAFLTKTIERLESP